MKLLPILLLLAACHTVERPVSLRSAELHIVVDDTAEALTAVAQSVEAAGGEVVQSEAWRENGHLRASVLLRVPQGELMRTLAAIRGEAVRVTAERVERRPLAGRYAGGPPAYNPRSTPAARPSVEIPRHRSTCHEDS